jgi:hypothetical protein
MFRGNFVLAFLLVAKCTPAWRTKSRLDEIRGDGGGIAPMAISALDVALWDIKAKLIVCLLVNVSTSSLVVSKFRRKLLNVLHTSRTGVE